METDVTPSRTTGSSSTQHKRRKSQVVTSDDEAEKQMLKKNTYNVLTQQSKATKGQSVPVVSIPESNTSARKQPPLVVKNIDFTTLADKVKSCNL